MDDPLGRWFIEIAILLICVFISACHATLKTTNGAKLHAQHEGDARLKHWLRLIDQPLDALLALRGLLLFLMMVFAANLTAWAFSGMAGWLGSVLGCLVAASVALILVLLLPEYLCKRHGDRLFSVLYPCMRFVQYALFPLVWVWRTVTALLLGIQGQAPQALEEVTEEEIRAMVDIGEESGAIESGERDMIENVFEFNNMTAVECMTHRTDVSAIWLEDDNDAILALIRETGLSRFPVYDEDIDDIVGVLATRDYLLNIQTPAPKPLQALLRDAYFVPDTVPCDVLFRNMQRNKTHMAIVVDEYGGTSGLITLEDLLEEIVGNIYDEFDPQDESEIQETEPGTWRVQGAVALDSLAEMLEVTLPQSEDYDTLGGLIFSRFTAIPEDGSTPVVDIPCTADGEAPDTDEYDLLHIEVLEVADHRVEAAQITLQRHQKDVPVEVEAE